MTFALLTVTSCTQQPTDPPATEAAPPAESAPASAPPAAIETTMAQSGVQPDAPAFDRKALAGTFTGTLPCADCPGIDETLRLSADGGFELIDEYRGRPDSTHRVEGTWAAEADGQRILLDPGNKHDVDHLYAIDDHDTLTQLGMDGARLEAAPDINFSLKRSE